MSITFYYGNTESPSINVESLTDLYQALNLIHTQVMDNIGDDTELLSILEDTMYRLEAVAEDRNEDVTA